MPHTWDHQLEINGTLSEYWLVRDDNNRAMYEVTENVPEYEPQLTFTQFDWISGHGQYAYREGDRYFEGQSIDTTQPGKVFLGPLITTVNEDDATDLDSAPVGFYWYESISKWLCFTAGNVYSFGTSWEASTSTLASVKQLVEFDGVLYAACGSGTVYYTSTDANAWTATDLSDNDADGFLVAPDPDGITQNLWKFKAPNEMTRTTNGGSGGVEWESPTYISDTSNNIINAFLGGDVIFVWKEDGLFSLDTNGGVHSELPEEFRVNHSTDNGKYVTNWQTSTYFSILRGMGEMTTTATFRPVGPLTEIDDIGKVGDVIGLTSDKDWLYVAEDEGTNSIIYKGREIWTGQELKWQWCPWIFLGTNSCATIRICQHATNDRRLWFGYGSNTGYVVLSDNPLAEGSATFCTSGYLRMSYTYGTNPNWDKLWQSAVVEQYRVNSGTITAAAATETVEVKYRDDTDIGSTSIVSAYSTAGVVETNFGTALADKRIQYELWLAGTGSTATPVVTFFQAKGVEKPTTVRIHDAYYRLGDKPSERTSTARTLLRAGRTSTNLIKFADLRYGQSASSGSTNYVWAIIMPGFPKEVEIKHEKQRQPELAIQVRLQEVSYTIS